MRRFVGPVLATLLAACATTPELGWQARHAAAEALREAVRFAEEPLPADSPLWDLPEVIVTPHDAGASAGNPDRVAEIFLDNLERWLRDEPLAGEVLQAG